MNSHQTSILLVVLLAAAMIVLLYLGLRPSGDENEGVDIQAEMKDPLLNGPITMIQHGTHTSKVRTGENGPFIVRYSTTYDGSSPRLVKTILSNKMPYLAACGHYVLYEHYRPDGTLELDQLVHPEPSLGGGVMVKLRERRFDQSGIQSEERYIRANGTVGVIFDLTSQHWKEFQNDGATLRFEQFHEGQSLIQVHYKRDGKTIWYKLGPDQHTRVFFDLHGNSVNKRLSREAAPESITTQQGEQSRHSGFDKYWREDGTLEYSQTWYQLYDREQQQEFEVVGAVTVFDAGGHKPLIEYKLDLRREGEPRFITTVEIHNTDGTRLVRKYRAPGIRLSEELLDARNAILSHREFDTSDRFNEPVNDNLFHGFGRRLWTYDDDRHIVD